MRSSREHAPRRARRKVAAALVAVLALSALAFTPGKAEAAGVTTHAWMDITAIDQVTNPQLKALLVANVDYVRSGAHFPDSGYALSNQYGEEAHWQRFTDALATRIRSRSDCPDLTDPHGPCAPLIAFMMGLNGHGMGDEVWDWLFEPTVADNNEYYTPPDLGDYANTGGAELQMDLEAIAEHGQPTTPPVPWPDHEDLLAAFNAAGFTQVDEGALNLGKVAMDVVHQAEKGWAPTHIQALKASMPWASNNMVTAPGGVNFAATAIAGEWNVLWGELLGDQPPTSVSITYPANGQNRIPATGWNRSHQPGSSPGRGGARTRIAAVLTYARPYNVPGQPPVANDQLPAGGMTLVERDTGIPVPIQSGFPRSVPYGSDSGEHTIDIQPAADLAPCTWYRASVTSAVIDAKGQPVVPYTWDFRTGTDADGHRCADDAYTPDENFARAVSADVLGRQATEPELQDVGYTFARGRTRGMFTKDVLASQEERSKLVSEAYQKYLGRLPEPGGLAYWSDQLKTLNLPSFYARLIGSDEVFGNAGKTNAGYVNALYPLILGRQVDPSGAAYWTGRLDAGLSRPSLAKRLLTSEETARNTVTAGYQQLLHRAPDQGGLDYWTGVVVRGADPRDLWRSLILSPEYQGNAGA